MSNTSRMHTGKQSKRTLQPVIRIHQTPQAVVRIVPRGGSRTAAQMQEQWKYLSRRGEVKLQRSERHLGVFLSTEQIAETAASWVEQASTKGGDVDDKEVQELTTHIVISFPKGTEYAKAFAAGRAWAEEMFGSGRNGGSFDYLTACHSDRPHPHIHLVVNRRALEGHWLKISRRDTWHNYQKMRSTMVDVARRYGIELEATSRAQRGINELPITYAVYRRHSRNINND